MIIKSAAPVRIDFAGGWTDVDMFARGAGGAVVNATIDKYVTGELVMPDDTEVVAHWEEDGIAVSYRSDLPTGSGLGTSATLNVVWLSLIKKTGVSSLEDRKMIAELAYNLEAVLGILGGRQDQYASAVGGLNYMHFGDAVDVEPIKLKPEVLAEMEQRLVLCYTGKPRLSSSIHENVWGAYKKGVPDTVNALYNIRNCAIRMETVLKEGDLWEFGELMNQNWKLQKQLDKSITNPQIENLFDIAFGAGVCAGKACGAGGGGCLIFLCAPGKRARVAEAVGSAGAKVIDFKFEFEGLRVWREES